MKITAASERTVTEKVETVLDIDTSKYARRWKYIAVDLNGEVYVYEDRPRAVAGEWKAISALFRVNDVVFPDPVTNWRDLCFEIDHRLPIGTIVVIDRSKITVSTLKETIAGVIVNHQGMGFTYTCRCVGHDPKGFESSPGHFTQYVSDEAIIAAFNPTTGKQLV